MDEKNKGETLFPGIFELYRGFAPSASLDMVRYFYGSKSVGVVIFGGKPYGRSWRETTTFADPNYHGN